MKNDKLNGAKAIILSKLRFGSMSSTEMMSYLSSVGAKVTRVRVHKIIRDFEKHGFVSVSDETRNIDIKSKSTSKRSVMIVKITKQGCDYVSVYLNSKIEPTFDAIKERITSTISDNDKATLKSNMLDLEVDINDLIKQNVNEQHDNALNETLAMFDKKRLVALEECCIETRKWLS